MPALSTRPPGPKPRPLIGNFPLAQADPLGTFEKWTKQFGDIFYYRAGWLHVYFLNHPDFVEKVLVTQYQNFIKDPVVRNTRWVFGEGLLTSEGESWLKQRRIIQPAFHRDRIAAYGETMANYTSEMINGWTDGAEVDIHQVMMKLTLKIVAKLLFNLEVCSESDDIASALNVLIRQGAGGRMILPPILRYLPIPAMARVRRAARQLDETAYGIIHARRQSGESNGDLLDMLMQARDENGVGMDDKQLRDEAITFLLAGHETTALTLSWAWFLLSENPEIENRFHEELERVLKGRSPGASDLSQLAFTEKVIKEAMRLYPPGWAVARTVKRDVEIGGYKIPAGANVVLSQWVMHRDARFFTNPTTFNPDRWTLETSPKFAYFPFGAGPRGCVAANLAFMEAHLLLAAIGQKFRLRLVSGHPVVPMPTVTLRPKHGIKVTLHAR